MRSCVVVLALVLGLGSGVAAQRAGIPLSIELLSPAAHGSVRVLDPDGEVVLDRDLARRRREDDPVVELRPGERYEVELEIGSAEDLGPIHTYVVRAARDVTEMRLEVVPDGGLSAVTVFATRSRATPGVGLAPDGRRVRFHNGGAHSIVVPWRLSMVYLDAWRPGGWQELGRIDGSADNCGVGGWGSVTIPPRHSARVDMSSYYVPGIALGELGRFRLRGAVDEIRAEGTVVERADPPRRPRLRRIDHYEVTQELDAATFATWVANGIDPEPDIMMLE